MGKPTGFMEIRRHDRPYAKTAERVTSYREFLKPLSDAELRDQGARCMDCGVPFCHNGCPVNNLIPDWNHLVYREDWRAALEALQSTNNFPEFTGRICPAPCEAACTLNINDDAVAIKTIECAVIDRGWQEGWIAPQPAARPSGKRVAIVGSGPAGLAAAQQLARTGHAVTVYEKHDRIGGLLRYGIPDFKMEKATIDRRVAQLVAEGVIFKTRVHVGHDLALKALVDGHDAVLLAGGAEAPRDLPVPGRDLAGVHFAMDYLTQQNRRVAGDAVPEAGAILAQGKRVVVLGGGDTGSDCIGTANRQGAAGIAQLEILPRPPDQEDKPLVWPYWPNKFRTSSSQEEGCERDFAVVTKGFEGVGGKVARLRAARVDWREGRMIERSGSEFALDADLVLLAMGFVHPVHEGMLSEESLGIGRDARGNVAADTTSYRTSNPKVFAAGDMRRGQSLVVWAIREGRQAARAIDLALTGRTDLPL
ncbi:MAG: glutamate synthase subunit beta [Alphaproteobacteria bacterium]|nr:glutamate synthase subunit beta [Alphaproteobacteria bacterium]